MTAAASFGTGMAHTLPGSHLPIGEILQANRNKNAVFLHVSVLLASRLLLGAGTSCSITGSGAYMADITKDTPDQRAKIMGESKKWQNAE